MSRIHRQLNTFWFLGGFLLFLKTWTPQKMCFAVQGSFGGFSREELNGIDGFLLFPLRGLHFHDGLGFQIGGAFCPVKTKKGQRRVARGS